MYIYVELFESVLYMSEIIIKKSNAKDKKFAAIILDKDGEKKKTINFGDDRYQDYTSHHDEKRKKNYLTRSEKQMKSNRPNNAAFFSRNLLWNKKTL